MKNIEAAVRRLAVYGQQSDPARLLVTGLKSDVKNLDVHGDT
jgi:hypothetical protein